MRRTLLASLTVLTMTLAACSSTSGPEGLWGAQEDNQPYLELAEDGKLSGTDGCNRLMSTWEAEESTITFGEVATTMMACDGVDTWLSGLASAERDGDTLTIKNASGETIGTLKRG